MEPIANEQLSPRNVPATDAEWTEILEFAQSFDGYEYWGSFERCSEVAAARAHGTLTTLRTCLFFEHRRWRNGDEAPPSTGTLKYWRSLVRKISAKVKQNSNSESEPGDLE